MSLPKDRFTRIWAAVLLATGVVLCFVPLLNLLAFEFAFALGLPVALCAGALGVRARRVEPDPWRAWWVSGRRALAFAAVPLVPITLNAARVQNCDYLEGLLFYALLPGLTAWIAAGWGVALARISPRRGVLLFVLLLIGSVLWGLLRFWLQPPVDAFNAFLGYYPGSIYDEVVPIGGRLIVSRVEDLAFVWAAVAISGLARRRGPQILAIAALLGAIGGRVAAYAWDIHRDAAHVRAALGGHRATANIDLYHPAGWRQDHVDRLATDLEFAYAELHTFLGVTPSERPAVYYYPNRATKKRLMGAGRTRIAKPWQRAMHLQAPRLGDAVVIHELAHVFSADIADGPLHLSMRGPLPHMGLIEGLAVAATWESGRLDGHQWSAAMRRAGVAPTLQSVLSPTGFLAKNSRTAYTLCGSFVRFQKAEEGRAAMADTYRLGAVAPPARLDTLVTRWEAFLDGQALDPRAIAEAKARFDRPAIFRKVCAHEVAALRADARTAIRTGQLDDALATLDALLGHVPRDVRARLNRISVLIGLDRTADAREAAQAVVADDRAGAIARSRAREWLADLAALDRDAATARRGYTQVLADGYDRAQLRRVSVKHAMLDAGPIGREVLALLTAPPGTPKALFDRRIAALEPAAADHPAIRYLIGRHHIAQRRWAQGEHTLMQTLASPLPHPALRFESERLLARAVFDQGRFGDAAVRFEALAARADLGIERGERFSLRRWARRARFFGRVDTTPAPSEDAAKSGTE